MVFAVKFVATQMPAARTAWLGALPCAPGRCPRAATAFTALWSQKRSLLLWVLQAEQQQYLASTFPDIPRLRGVHGRPCTPCQSLVALGMRLTTCATPAPVQDGAVGQRRIRDVHHAVAAAPAGRAQGATGHPANLNLLCWGSYMIYPASWKSSVPQKCRRNYSCCKTLQFVTPLAPLQRILLQEVPTFMMNGSCDYLSVEAARQTCAWLSKCSHELPPLSTGC